MSMPSTDVSLRRAPRVGLIGRPNVGKSSLFNYLTRRRQAVVKNQPGVTRDILIEPTEWWGKKFDVIDTGGLTEATDTFSPLIREQVLSMMTDMDLLVVMMDGRTGLIPEDRDLVRIAKESGKPFCLAVNKVDRWQDSEMAVSEFYEFGMEPLACSVERQQGIDEVVEWILHHLPQNQNTQRQGQRIAIVGKPNVGKSSLCNQLLGQKRMLVSETAGTTVDAVEHEFSYQDQDYILVDTAGLRRRSKRYDDVEVLSAFKSRDAIMAADVVLLLVDVQVGPTDQDARMVEQIMEHHKPVVLVANKMDLAGEEPRRVFRAQVERQFHFYPDIPIAFISATHGRGLKDLFVQVQSLFEKLQRKISTSKLNDFFYSVIRQAPAPVYGTKNVKFYYLTQTQQTPPSFIAFANHPEGVNPSYRRFLTKRLQQEFDLTGVPLRLFVMKSGGK